MSAAWKLCDSPAGGCGYPRRRIWTERDRCFCGSELRLAKIQPPVCEPCKGSGERRNAPLAGTCEACGGTGIRRRRR